MGTANQEQMDACWRVCNRLWELQLSGTFCDLRLETEDHQFIRVHKLIAAAGSPVLQALLMSSTGFEGEQKLTIPKVCFTQLRAIVQLLYLGTAEDRDAELGDICQELQISEGIQFCEKQRSDTEQKFPPGDEKSVVPLSLVFPNKSTGKDSDGNIGVMSSERLVEESLIEGCSPDLSSEVLSEKNITASCSHTNTLRAISSDDVCENRSSELARSSFSSLPVSYIEPDLPRSTCQRAKSMKRTSGNDDMEAVDSPQPKSLRGHMITKCKTCNLKFDSVKDYKRHREDIHANNNHKCSECGVVFKRPKQLVAHKVREHYQEGMKEPGWYYCKAEGCGYKSIYTSSVESHYNHNHLREDVMCELCGNKYQSRYCLESHRRQVHRMKSPATCSTCGKTFKSDTLLKCHIRRVHEKMRPYLCEKCPYRSFDSNSLQRHIFKNHQDVQKESNDRNQCPHCDFSDTSFAKLSEHIERHNPKKRECPVCKRKLATYRDLRVHMKNIHSSAKDQVWISCQYEGCTFSCKARYGKRRMREHTDRIHEKRNYKPWTCTECSYHTNVKGNLRLHMKNVHGLSLPSAQHLVDKLPSQDPSSVSVTNDTETHMIDEDDRESIELLQVPVNTMEYKTMTDENLLCLNYVTGADIKTSLTESVKQQPDTVYLSLLQPVNSSTHVTHTQEN